MRAGLPIPTTAFHARPLAFARGRFLSPAHGAQTARHADYPPKPSDGGIFGTEQRPPNLVGIWRHGSQVVVKEEVHHRHRDAPEGEN